jgi:hypothetical protein
LPTCIPLLNNSNVSLYEASEFIKTEFTDFIATPLVECVQYNEYLCIYKPIRVGRWAVNHLLTISRDGDWSNDLDICCDCVESKFNCVKLVFKENNVGLFNQTDVLFQSELNDNFIDNVLHISPYPDWVLNARQDVPVHIFFY